MGLARLVGDWWWLLAAPVFVGLVALFAFVSPYLEPTHPIDDPTARARRSRRSSDGPTSATSRCGSRTSPGSRAERRHGGDRPEPAGRALGHAPRRPLHAGRGQGRDRPRARAREATAHPQVDRLVRALRRSLAPTIISRVTRRRGGMGEPAAVPLALLTLVVLELLALPLQNAITRHMEAEADWLALQTTHDPQGRGVAVREVRADHARGPGPADLGVPARREPPDDRPADRDGAGVEARYATSASAAQLP